MKIKIQSAPFNLHDEMNQLYSASCGAYVSFVGNVRDRSNHKPISSLYIEHFPELTETLIENICSQAKARWDIQDYTVIHRIGHLLAGESIVLIIVASAHRKQAFAACEFIMDYLKNQATLWKKEFTTDNDEYWVSAKTSDQLALSKWD